MPTNGLGLEVEGQDRSFVVHWRKQANWMYYWYRVTRKLFKTTDVIKFHFRLFLYILVQWITSDIFVTFFILNCQNHPLHPWLAELWSFSNLFSKSTSFIYILSGFELWMAWLIRFITVCFLFRFYMVVGSGTLSKIVIFWMSSFLSTLRTQIQSKSAEKTIKTTGSFGAIFNVYFK